MTRLRWLSTQWDRVSVPRYACIGSEPRSTRRAASSTGSRSKLQAGLIYMQSPHTRYSTRCGIRRALSRDPHQNCLPINFAKWNMLIPFIVLRNCQPTHNHRVLRIQAQCHPPLFIGLRQPMGGGRDKMQRKTSTRWSPVAMHERNSR